MSGGEWFECEGEDVPCGNKFCIADCCAWLYMKMEGEHAVELARANGASLVAFNKTDQGGDFCWFVPDTFMWRDEGLCYSWLTALTQEDLDPTLVYVYEHGVIIAETSQAQEGLTILPLAEARSHLISEESDEYEKPRFIERVREGRPSVLIFDYEEQKNPYDRQLWARMQILDTPAAREFDDVVPDPY